MIVFELVILRWNSESCLINNEIASELGNRLNRFSDISTKLWINCQSQTDLNNVELPKSWDRDYTNDKHPLRCILKVDSHKLNKSGTDIAQTPRYKNILPNLALTNANHFADIAAENSLKIKTEDLHDLDDYPENSYYIPDSNLRFFLAWENKSVDKNTNKFIQSKLHEERKRRLGFKNAQGLGQRVLKYTNIKWQNINLGKGWIRAFLGFSNTHTRSFYKSICTFFGSRTTQNHLLY